MNPFSQLNHRIFWPPFILLAAAIVLSLVNQTGFLEIGNTIQSWILDQFDWLFNWASLLFLCLVLYVYFSPLSKIRLGGPNAQPLLTPWKWFSICLCTTIATGILFWGTAEPIYHLHQPGGLEQIEPFSTDARDLAMSSMFLHWTFTPYAIYTMAALVFALVFYNMGRSFRISSLLYPLTGRKLNEAVASAIDSICLFALIAGMAASLGTGILTISGGLNSEVGIPENSLVRAVIALVIVGSFVLSAVSGLHRGIRILSDINTRLFVLLGVFVFVFGPTIDILKASGAGLLEYILHFIPRSTGTDPSISTSWTHDWTTFYWANWMAWTPVTALFLGRLGRGYTVKKFIEFNLLLPALFSMLWMGIFSGTSLHIDLTSNQILYQVLQASGPQNVVYTIFSQLPLAELIPYLFIFMVFLSFVTAADSNTSAMSGISSTGITPTNQEAPIGIKIVWGVLIGIISWVMVAFSGIDGVRQLSVIGGFPALIVLILIFAGLLKLCLSSDSLNK